MKRSKKYLEAVKQVEKEKLYNILEAIELSKKVSYKKFDESIDMDLRLNIQQKII